LTPHIYDKHPGADSVATIESLLINDKNEKMANTVDARIGLAGAYSLIDNPPIIGVRSARAVMVFISIIFAS